MIQLVGIDVDGTLVGSTGVIDPRVWEAVERAHAAGIRLALCSGRPAFGLAVEYARRLDRDGWHIFQNGASIVHLRTWQSRSVSLSTEWVKTVIADARRSGEVLELYADDSYVVESTTALAQEHAKLLGVDFDPRPFESLEGPAVRAQWLLSTEQAKQLMSVPHPGVEIAQSTSPLMPGTQFVGLTQEGVSKGSAMRTVAQEYGVELRDVMYIGDSGNDLSALRIVGHPVAMANADAAVLKAATYVAGHVEEGGVAQALYRAIAVD